MRSIRQRLAPDDGSAIIEFIFVAVIVMVPLVYFIVGVADIQRSSFAVGQAAREAGRAFATSESTADGLRRARAAARLALGDQGVAGEPDITFHPTGASCSGPTVNPNLEAGAEYTVCVTRTVLFAGVPTIMQGRGVRTIGKYVLHVDDYRLVER